MTDEAKPSETEAAKPELFLSVFPDEESKEEEKTLSLSSALAELVVGSKDVEKFQIRKGLKRKMNKM